MKKYMTRMGDGSIVHLSEEEIREDIALGVDDAAKRGKIAPLSEADMEKLFEIITMPGIIVGVEHGRQVVSSTDQGADTIGCECGTGLDRALTV